MKLARTLGLVCGLGVAMPALAKTAALPAKYPADYGTIISGAKAEKCLLIYTNMEVVQWEGAVKILKEMVPGIDVPLPRTEQRRNRLALQCRDIGRHSVCGSHGHHGCRILGLR